MKYYKNWIFGSNYSYRVLNVKNDKHDYINVDFNLKPDNYVMHNQNEKQFVENCNLGPVLVPLWNTH